MYQEDQLGYSVSVSGDTIVVGAPYVDVIVPFDDRGAAYVYDPDQNVETCDSITLP